MIQITQEIFDMLPKDMQAKIHNQEVKDMMSEAKEFVASNGGVSATIDMLRSMNKCCNKVYHYGITLTRNPTKDTIETFVKKALKMLAREWFSKSDVEWAFECYNNEGESINEHIHVYVKSDSSLRMNDLKRSYPNNRIDMQKLYGDKIPKTRNYIAKDIDCDNTKAHYQKYGLEKHHSL